jgi:heparinase II/III-like protein
MIKQTIHLKFDKFNKIFSEQGCRVAVEEIVSKVKRKLQPDSQVKSLRSHHVVFSNLDKKAIEDDINKFMAVGLFRTSNEIKGNLCNLGKAHFTDVLDEAEKLINREFRIYGLIKVTMNSKQIYWTKDPLSGHLWSRDLKPGDKPYYKNNGVDIKNVWELGRFQYLYALAICYLVKSDKRYAQAAIDIVTSWIDANHFSRGPHWMRAMEVSIRLLNWCFYLPLLDVFALSDNTFKEKIINSIIEHLIFIAENLEISPSHSNNHYLADLVGLLLARLIFPSSKWANGLSKFAEDEFKKEVLKQFKKSGLNFEGSLAYQRLSTEIGLLGLALLKKGHVEVEENVIDRLKRSVKLTKSYERLGEECPIIGDNDNGIIIKYFPKQEMNTHGYLQAMYDGITGQTGKSKCLSEFLCTVHFAEPGSRGSFNQKGNELQGKLKIKAKCYDGLVIASQGNDGIFFVATNLFGGHVHNDKLSVYPILAGKPLFVERGCRTYTALPDVRYKDRSAFYHNAPRLNNWEQNQIWERDPFYIGRSLVNLQFLENENGVLKVAGSHNGYERYQAGLIVYRYIEWDINRKKILIMDWAHSHDRINSLNYSWRFLVNPAWSVRLANRFVQFDCPEMTAELEVIGSVKINIEEDSYSPSYQITNSCQSLNFNSVVSDDACVMFVIHYSSMVDKKGF